MLVAIEDKIDSGIRSLSHKRATKGWDTYVISIDEYRIFGVLCTSNNLLVPVQERFLLSHHRD